MVKPADLVLGPAFAGLGAIGALSSEMDHDQATACGRLLGRIWYHALPLRRSTVEKALSTVFPRRSPHDIRHLTCRILMNTAANVTTFLWATAPGRTAEEILRVVRFEGFSNWLDVRHRGAILACSHTGNWDLAALAARVRGVRLAVLSRNLSHGPTDRMWNRSRRAGGLRILDGSTDLATVAEHLGPGRALAVMTDQRTGPGQGGILVPFLSCPAWTSTLCAALALRHHLPVLEVTARTGKGGEVIVEVSPAMEPRQDGSAFEAIRAMTARLSSDLSTFILRHPDSWLWLHRRWADEPRPSENSRRTGAKPHDH